MFHLDVASAKHNFAKVDRDVAYVAMVVYTYVASFCS
jgi:hypothetical protein